MKTERPSITVARLEAILEAVIQDASEIWAGSSSDVPQSSEFVSRIIRQAFETFLKRIKPLKADIDSVAIQLNRASVPVVEGVPEEPIIKLLTGPLEELFPRDSYRDEIYPFIDPRINVHLKVKILGTNALKKEKPLSNDLFVTSLTALTFAQQEIGDTEARIDYVLSKSKTKIKDRRLARSAARIALESTKNTRQLMGKEFIRSEKSKHLSLIKRFRLPHLDERNLLFVPVFVGSESIGGVAVYSHHELPAGVISILDAGLHLLFYRLRSGDEIAASKLAANERARWEATLMYVHRLSHDVRKPIGQALTAVSSLVGDATLPSHARETLQKLFSELTNLNKLIATRAGVSLVELREQAKRDARRDRLAQLLEDAVWVWRGEARRKGKEIDISAPDDGYVRIPRFLVSEVLSNLVSNGIRFAQKAVSVSAERIDGPSGSKVRFKIRDDGPGIAKEIRKRLFVPYYTDRASPPGLGLRLSKFIVEDLLSGSLSLNSTPKGAVVTFTIPEVSENEKPHPSNNGLG